MEKPKNKFRQIFIFCSIFYFLIVLLFLFKAPVSQAIENVNLDIIQTRSLTAEEYQNWKKSSDLQADVFEPMTIISITFTVFSLVIIKQKLFQTDVWFKLIFTISALFTFLLMIAHLIGSYVP